MENVQIELQVPDVGYMDIKNVMLSADANIILNYTFVIPETILNGNHNIEVQLTSSGNTLTQNFIFIIPESNINIVGISRTGVPPVNNIELNIENTGGVDTDINYTIELYGSKFLILANLTSTTNVRSASSALLELPIPNSAISGKYYVQASCLDVKTNKTNHFLKETEVDGNEISLKVKLIKIYTFQTNP